MRPLSDLRGVHVVGVGLHPYQHGSTEMLDFLTEQKHLLRHATSEGEFNRLLIETESRMLGETVNWYARRSVVGVS